MDFDKTTYIYIGVAVVVLILIVISVTSMFSGKSKQEENKQEEIKNKQITMPDLKSISNFDTKTNSINNATGPKEMSVKSSNELTIQNQN
jgi:flagellar basal body-associated protein FliL